MRIPSSCTLARAQLHTSDSNPWREKREKSPNSLRPYTWQEALDAKQAARPLVEASALSLNFKFLCAAGPE